MSNFYESGKAALTSERDDWETPQRLFDQLNERWGGFSLDAFASDANHKCDEYFTKETDGLRQDWTGHRVFANPPYGRRMRDFTRKCAEETRNGVQICMLVPARTDTAWAWEDVFPHADILFLKGRLKYELNGVPLQSSPFPSMLCLYNLEHEDAVRIRGDGKPFDRDFEQGQQVLFV